MRIGIIGAENSHAAAVAKLINVEKKFPDVRVAYLWGETEEFARNTAKAGKIPVIVRSPREMLGNVDGIMVDHRHGKHHLKAALPFIKKGIPAFIDKPFCFRASEGREFLEIARRHGASVTSYSTIPVQKSFASFRRATASTESVSGGVIWGPADMKSPYGGIFSTVSIRWNWR